MHHDIYLSSSAPVLIGILLGSQLSDHHLIVQAGHSWGALLGRLSNSAFGPGQQHSSRHCSRLGEEQEALAECLNSRACAAATAVNVQITLDADRPHTATVSPTWHSPQLPFFVSTSSPSPSTPPPAHIPSF